MVVKKKIKPSVDSFIDKGADVKANKEKGFKNILIRVPIKILDQLDDILKDKPWLNRNQIIVNFISEKLKEEG